MWTSLPPHAGPLWLAGVDSVVAADRHRLGMASSGTNDFMDLFRSDAPWGRAAAAIQVFKVSTQFLHRSTDDQLKRVLDDLRRRHIELAFAGEIMATTPRCGNGMPGFTTQAVIQTAADRVKRMGGRIDYVAFDSPVAFGHFNILQRAGACRYSIPDLIRNIAPQIQILRTAFPDIRFGDVEPVNNDTVGWLATYLEFAREFQAQTGTPLSFLHADIIWYDNWRPQLVEWRTRLRAAGLSYGVIFDGSAIDKDNLSWAHHSIERYRTVTFDPATAPEDVIIQTWHDYPTRFMPETQPGTLTWVVLQTLTVKP